MRVEAVLFNDRTTSPCLRCCKPCPCSTFSGPGRNPQQQLTVAIAGTTCVAFSRQGLREGQAHVSMRPFTIWACETAAMLPDIVVHENTPEFPVSLLAQFFGRRYEIMSTLVSPEMFGWPAERYRRYTIMCRKDTVLFAGTLDDFKAVFQGMPACSGDVFFAAQPGAQRQALSRLLESRHMSPDIRDSGPEFDWAQAYTAATRERLVDFEARRAAHQGLDGSFLADLSQHANRSKPGTLMPSLLKHAFIYSWKHKRHALGQELIASQGLPVLAACGRDDIKCPWQAAADKMSEATLTSLAGNAMNCLVISSLMAYIFSTTTKLPQASMLYEPASMLVDDDEETPVQFDFGSCGSSSSAK